MTDEAPGPGDFGGTCLLGQCRFDGELLLPTSSYFGTRKVGSFLLGSWRDGEGNLLRAIRGIDTDASNMRFLFESARGRQLERNVTAEQSMWAGPVMITSSDEHVRFASKGSDPDQAFEYLHEPNGCTWTDGDVLAVDGRSCGPATQWFNTWSGGACFSVSADYRSSGEFLGRPVEGFIVHEIHYFTEGSDWLASPFGRGREICWQHVANEYDDGSIMHGTFAYGSEGWGFVMIHDERDGFRASVDVEVEATVRPSGCPETITYRFLDERWTWRLDPQGERAAIMAESPLIGADGTCTRDGDSRNVRLSMGNSDWWLDGRADPVIRRGQ